MKAFSIMLRDKLHEEWLSIKFHICFIIQFSTTKESENTDAVAMKYSLVCLTILGITIKLVLQYFLEKYVYLKVSFQDFTSFEDTLFWSFPH